MSKAAASTSSHKSSSPAAALVTTKDTLTFRLHPKQLIAFRSKATEILYRGAAGGGKPPHPPAAAVPRGRGGSCPHALSLFPPPAPTALCGPPACPAPPRGRC